MVRDLHPTELDRATEVLVHAFDEDPALRHVLPDAEVRRRVGPRLARAWLTYAMRYGRVFVTDGLEGVALRRPPGQEHLSVWGLIVCGFLPVLWALGPRAVWKLLVAGHVTDARHQAAVSEPHWYCWLLAVDPKHQGEGHGGALIRHTFAQADRQGRLCYLETSSERALSCHRRHGWEVVDAGVVPGTDLMVWNMVRRPALAG